MVEFFQDRLFGGAADELVFQFAAAEKQQRWHSAHAVALHERRIVVDVHLRDAEFPSIFPGNLVEQRRDHFARSAPWRPEIHQDRDGRLEDGFFKTGFIDVDGFVHVSFCLCLV